jgi:hypothetical protein
MKTSKILLQSDKSNNKETPIKVGAGKLLKSILVIFMLLWITLLSSCFVSGPRHARPGNMNERHGHDQRHGNNERHGHDERRDK